MLALHVEVGLWPGAVSACTQLSARSWWFRPAAWPDGRLLNANEDATTRVWLGVVFLLVAMQVWVHGRSDRLDAAVGDSLWILIGGLVAASVLCTVGTRKRVWERASSADAAGPGADGPILLKWVRAPRWPDGRRFAVRDPALTAAALASAFAAYATVWLLGEAGVPRIDISAYQDLLLGGLQVAAATALSVVTIRVRVVQAVVEGWADDDSELSFVQGRIAAVAATAKRAKSQFASDEKPQCAGTSASELLRAGARQRPSSRPKNDGIY